MTDLHDILIAGRMLGGSGGSPAPEPVLIAKTITANGTYSAAAEGADGYSEVTAAVPELPVTFVKSIKSLGNSIIVTDIVPLYTDTLVVDFLMGADISGGTQSAYACACGNDGGLYGFGVGQSSNNLPIYMGNDWTVTDYLMRADGRDTVRPNTLRADRNGSVLGQYGLCEFGMQKFWFTADGNKKDITSPFAIGGYNGSASATPGNAREMTFYRVQLLRNDIPIHSLVPARHKTTTRAGMYDLLTGKFYPSDSRFDDFITEV